jgi:hypothetical protein
MTTPPNPDPARFKFLNEPAVLTKRHLRFGWWMLLVFVVLGLVLEGLHAFKSNDYLGVKNETRRLMWTLAHAHGTLLGVVNVLFALSVRLLPEWAARERGIASDCLRAATLLIPAGFFLGGVRIYSGDPGLGIILVPIGALLLILAVFLVACGTGSIRNDGHANSKGGTTTFQRRGEK